MTRIMVTLYKDQYSFLIISLPVLLRTINVSENFAEKIDILPSETFSEIVPFMR
jgi:hypothetical protein